MEILCKIKKKMEKCNVGGGREIEYTTDIIVCMHEKK